MLKYVIPVLLAPAAAVVVFWVLPEVWYPSHGSAWFVVIPSLALIGGLGWTALQTRSVRQTLLIGGAMVVSTFALWWVALFVILVIAGVNCPDDANECPI